jgi:hypothetical protein
MSARLVGTPNRNDFLKNEAEAYENQPPVGAVIMGDDPLQLEHMVGYAGNFKGTVQFLPNNDNCYIKRFPFFYFIL